MERTAIPLTQAKHSSDCFQQSLVDGGAEKPRNLTSTTTGWSYYVCTLGQLHASENLDLKAIQRFYSTSDVCSVSFVLTGSTPTEFEPG